MVQHLSASGRATVDDVAGVAGVSRTTVSRALNGGFVAPHTRAAVEAAIAATGYTPNTAARNLAARRSRAVGLIVLEPRVHLSENSHLGAMLLGANVTLSVAGYQLMSLVVDSARDAERVIHHLSGRSVDGTIIVAASGPDPLVDMLDRTGLPAAYIGRPAQASPGVPFVSVDNIGAARAVTRRLIDTGRTRIGMIAAAVDRWSGAERVQGFRQALGASFDAALVAEVPRYDYQSGVAGMRVLLAREPAIDGVFAASDVVAAGALEVLHEAGLAVPSRIGVVGFGDSAWALRTEPALSTVRQPAAAIGARAADLVVRQLHGEAYHGGELFLPAPVVWRASA